MPWVTQPCLCMPCRSMAVFYRSRGFVESPVRPMTMCLVLCYRPQRSRKRSGWRLDQSIPRRFPAIPEVQSRRVDRSRAENTARFFRCSALFLSAAAGTRGVSAGILCEGDPISAFPPLSTYLINIIQYRLIIYNIVNMDGEPVRFEKTGCFPASWPATRGIRKRSVRISSGASFPPSASREPVPPTVPFLVFCCRSGESLHGLPGRHRPPARSRDRRQ